MSVSRKKRLIVAIALAGATFSGLSAAPANADCIAVEASYAVLGGPRTYLVRRTCVHDPGWPNAAGANPALGDPDVVMIQPGVWIPAP